ncbi:MAG TPA: diaminopropionate ammonia-lyase [Firmicutes bacterium]|nr:diaminopropionate ammonia-lyase [Bacillota bacterium]
MTQLTLDLWAGAPSAQPNAIPTFCHPSAATVARRFHCKLPGYRPTSLHDLKGLARLAGVGKVLVKNEAERFGLDAFKVLGASFAVANLLARRLGLEDDELDLAVLAARAQAQLGQQTFVTATDGNHGRAVAWAAQQLGQQAVVYLPQGAAKSRIDAITRHGAKAIVVAANYDAAVLLAAEQADGNGWLLVQDTAWDGYEEIPAWIMQGYTTLAAESWEQMQELGLEPTHVFLQAGVGSLAGSQLGYWQTQKELKKPPQFVVMEPSNAACFYSSARQGDKRAHTVTGDLQTIMAGLSCGQPNPLAWPLLRDYATAFVSCPDYVAAYGMRILGNPCSGDQRIIAGESGAIGAGVLALLADPRYSAWRQLLGLDEDSVVLLINTEGATDPISYRDIVWGGQYPLP